MDEILKFPREVRQRNGRGRPTSEEYIIPTSSKREVLKLLYPFSGIPALDEQRYDLHEGKRFSVADFKVVREDDMNYLVSPYYYESGGTVIDWMPANFGDEQKA